MSISRMSLILQAFTIALIVPINVHADARLANTVANSAVAGNTNQYTPPIYEVWPSSYPCWTNFTLDTNFPPLAAKFQHVPLPCFFTPSAGADGEAVLLEHGLYDGHERTYEFWQASWQNVWHARWGGADD